MWSYIFLFAFQVFSIQAGTVNLDWSIDWINISPDGFSRPAPGINGQWPLPSIYVNIGDRLIINLTNNLQNETTTIHFHGIHQNGTNQMDGPGFVTQCPIPPGGTFTYDFTIDQPGTYWYHSHIGGQYIDGLRGPLIVHDPAAPYANQIDQEIVLTLSDWYHTQAPYLIEYFESPLNENLHGGSEPVPNATLINDEQNVKFPIKAGETYLFRVINMGAFAAQYLYFDQHDMTIVEVDGIYTEPYKVSQLFLTVAQRYSVIVTAKSNSKQNFAVVASMDEGMFDETVIPPGLNNNVTGWLVYDSTKPLPKPPTFNAAPFDDTQLVPYDKQPLLGPVTFPITLDFVFANSSQGQNRALINGTTYIPQKVPTLYTALSAPAQYVDNPKIYGANSNPVIIPYNAIVELTVINYDNGPHPFHLHAHQFQVISRSPGNDGSTPDPVSTAPPPKIPMRRDTLLINGLGNAVFRFKADNPGITIFHCHIEWHVEAGLTATFIEAPHQLQAQGLTLPQNHIDACKAQGIPTVGNAAGNSQNWLDLTGAPTVPPLQDWGALVNPPTQRRIRRGLLNSE